MSRSRRVPRWAGPKTRGAVVLSTVAPRTAVICVLDYTEPFSAEQKEAFRRDHPAAQFREWHTEREYVVDRRYFQAVGVARRYPPADRLA